MNKSNDEILCNRYPEIFVNRHGDMRTTLMCWGFDCGDGWFNIIESACARIQNHIAYTISDNKYCLEYNEMASALVKGDDTLFRQYHNYTKDEKILEKRRHEILTEGFREVIPVCPQVVAVQIKEKFGTLRFYYDGGDDFCRGVVSMAEAMSAVTCEVCAAPGKSNDGGWIRTLCDIHHEERENK